MKLFVELFVDDLEVSSNFYREVLGMEQVRSSPGYIELRLGDAQINLCLFAGLKQGHYLQEAPNDRLGNRVEFCLEVDNLEELYERVKRHGVAIKERPGERPARSDFRILDPNGAYLRITSPSVKGTGR